MKTLSLLCVLATATAATAAAQDLLANARAHYAAAEYEAALAALADVGENAADRIEVEQYRALSLIALGRNADAERALSAIVRADPVFVPTSEDVSPRVMAMFADVRRKLLPEIARDTFGKARAAFQEKNAEQATRQFELVMTLLDDPLLKGDADHDDLRVLASGFLDLTLASAAPPAAEPEPSAAEPPAPPVVEPPVPIDQRLPLWNPPDTAAATRDYSGAIVVMIGADGRVKSAAMRRPTYPLYDALLLQAARLWTYRPAMKNGQPIESEKVIEIQLRGR